MKHLVNSYSNLNWIKRGFIEKIPSFIFTLLIISTLIQNTSAQSLALNDTKPSVEYVTQLPIQNFSGRISLQNYYLKFYEEKNQSLDFNTVSAKDFAKKWQSFNDLTHPLSPHQTYWAKLTIQNPVDKEENWLLFMGFMAEAEVFVLYPDGNYEHSLAGFFVPNQWLKPREGEFVKTIFKLPAKSKVNIFVKFKNTLPYPPQPEFSLQTEKNWQTEQNQTNLIQGIFQGLLLMIVLYNLVLFTSVNDKTYLHLALYALFVSLYFLNEYEYLEHYFLPQYPQVSFYLSNLIYVGLIFYIQFNRWFLNIPSDYPRWDKVVLVWLTVSTLFALSSFPLAYFAYDYYIPIRNSYHVFFSAALLLFIFMALWMNDLVAVYFILGNFCVLAGGIFIVMGNQGIIPQSLYYLLGGIASQMFIFMLALSYRFRKNMLEQQSTQVKLIQQLQENDKLQTKVNRELEEKVKERTLEIAQQKEEIQSQNDTLHLKSTELEHAYNKITDSMRYAQRLQSAMLGDEQAILKDFPNAFAILLPKDIVSGDFYWATKVGNTRVLVAADCTGHGIPGALMTILGNSALNIIVNEKKVVNPLKILYELDKKVIATTEKRVNGKKPQDGMDVIVVSYDERTQILRYAGAKNPLYYVRDFEIHQIKASKSPIGFVPNQNHKNFELHEFKVEPDDIFYLTSDGFQDQLGQTGQKYMTKNFRRFLLKNSHLPLAVQKDKLLSEFYQWKGEKSQTDDVLVIGVKF
jgi:serine phosphatase RsbU (regulator of sigma subunit)